MPTIGVERGAAQDLQSAARDGINQLAGLGEMRVIKFADSTIGYNVRRDPAKPRWAIVPHPGACGWCLMVAGNGWAYSKTSVYAQRHANCKCSVAVDFNQDSPSLKGYDPARYRGIYSDAASAVADDVTAQWNAMSTEERRQYRRKGRSAKDVYMTKRVTRMMDGMTGHSPMTVEDKALYDAWKAKGGH